MKWTMTLLLVLLLTTYTHAQDTANDDTTEPDVPIPATTLVAYGDGWQAAVNELEHHQLIAMGGQLVTQQAQMTFTGAGSFIAPMSANRPQSDIVIAGELTFRVGNADNYEQCGLTARINGNSAGAATTFIDIAFLNDGSLLVQDVFSETQRPRRRRVALNLDLSQPHHLLAIVQDETLSVYVDGERAVERFRVGDRAGTVGLSLIGAGPGTRCEGHDLWVYHATAFEPGRCEAASSVNAHRRTGPGTGYTSAGVLIAQTVVRVTGQIEGEDGYTWWQLADDSWVREDVVRTIGDCANVPTVN